jgi:hypothetical protein
MTFAFLAIELPKCRKKMLEHRGYFLYAMVCYSDTREACICQGEVDFDLVYNPGQIH